MKHNFQIHSNKTEFFYANDTKIAYDVVLNSNSNVKPEILLLINGFQRTRSDFKMLRQKIANQTDHIISVGFDNRFCGQTEFVTQDSHEKNITLFDFAQDSLALLKHCMTLFNTERVHVIGISMGGMIAQILASLPDCPALQNLFLVSTTAGGHNRIWPTEAHLQKNAPIETNNESMSPERVALYFGEKFLKFSSLLFKTFVQNIQQTIKTENDEKAFRSQAIASQNFEGIQDFESLKAKNVIIISGDEDKIMPLENSKILSRLIPNSNLIVYPHVGHLILIENPNEFVNNIVHYIT